MHSVLRLSECLVTVALLFLFAAAATAQELTASFTAMPVDRADANQGDFLERPVRLVIESARLQAALIDLQDQTGIPIVFSEDLLPQDLRVNCACGSVTVREALDSLLAPTGLRYVRLRTQILIEPRPRLRQDIALIRAFQIVPHRARVSLTAYAAADSDDPLAVADFVGSVTGTVVDAGTQRPLTGAQVHVPGTQLGTISNSSGRYLLLNAPTGQVTVRVQMLGYASEEQTVSVSDGQATTADFSLQASAISLDELVVTGTAAATERRKLGNTLASIDASDLVSRAPIKTFDELIKGRAAGVSLLPSSGQVGAGGAIRIRGMVSISQDNGPLIYVDGVRLDNSSTGPGVGGQKPTRIQDIVTTDIERVEIVKGAAATTLYGTEASAGVIQIFTKRGQTGAPQWDFQTEQGTERIPNVLTGDLYSRFVGPDGFRARNASEVIETGRLQTYSGSVSGGVESLRYYLGGRYNTQQGSITPELNHLQQISGRFNLSVVASDEISITANAGYTNSSLRLPENDNANYGVLTNVQLGVPYQAREDKPWGEPFNSHIANGQLENMQSVHHFTGGVSFEYNPNGSLRNLATVGLDLVSEENTKYFPFGFVGSAFRTGRKDDEHRTSANVTVDLRSSLSNRILQNLSSEFSVGLQGNFADMVTLFAQGLEFPAPGVSTVGAGARTSGSETRVEEVTAGVFLQETIGLLDRLFVTAGLRVDGNSAFGGNFSVQQYPKASVAYNISEEGFWPAALWPTMKLRTAYGTSGLAPAQFAADQTFMPVAALDGVPAVTPQNLGDPDLGPEKSTEFEIGFDAGFLEDRLGLVVTYYRQKTVDALLPVQFPPSQGFEQRQLKNVGEIRNEGFETEIRALWISTPSVELESSLQLTTQTNEVVDMGGAATIFPAAASAIQVREGYPILGQWHRPVVGWDPETRTHLFGDTAEYVGSATPDFYGSYGMELRLFENLVVSGMMDWATGHYMSNGTRYFRNRYRTGDEYLSLLNAPSGARTPAADSLYNLMVTGAYGGVLEPADWLKLREIGVSYQLPNQWISAFGVRHASVSVSGRNLHTFTDYTGSDPEVNWAGTDNLIRGVEFFTVPQARRFVIAVRAGI